MGESNKPDLVCVSLENEARSDRIKSWSQREGSRRLWTGEFVLPLRTLSGFCLAKTGTAQVASTPAHTSRDRRTASAPPAEAARPSGSKAAFAKVAYAPVAFPVKCAFLHPERHAHRCAPICQQHLCTSAMRRARGSSLARRLSCLQWPTSRWYTRPANTRAHSLAGRPRGAQDNVVAR